MLSVIEKERVAYLKGDTEKADLLTMAYDFAELIEMLPEIRIILQTVDGMGGIDQIRETLKDLKSSTAVLTGSLEHD